MVIINSFNSHQWDEYFRLRWEVLRKPWGQPIGSEKDNLEAEAFHAAILVDNKIIAVGRLDKIDAYTGQIRYMAVHPDFEGKGWGNYVLANLDQKAKAKGLQKIMLHAREKAINFYLRNNYTLISKSYVLFGEIQHYLMEKQI